MILTLNASGIVTFSHDFQDDCGLPKFPRFLQMPSTMQALCLQLLDWRELVTNIVLSCKAIQRLLSSSRLVWQYVCIKTATGVFENQEKLNHLLTVPCPRSLSWDYAQFSSSNSPLLQYLDHLKAKRHILHSLTVRVNPGRQGNISRIFIIGLSELTLCNCLARDFDCAALMALSNTLVKLNLSDNLLNRDVWSAIDWRKFEKLQDLNLSQNCQDALPWVSKGLMA